MIYTVELSAEKDQKLRVRASEAGKTPVDLIVAAVRQDNHRAELFEQRRNQLAENFQKLGVSDEAFADELEEIKHQMRAERRGRAAS